MHTDSARHAEILPAATVILTRERAGELQVFLLKRSQRSGFMADMPSDQSSRPDDRETVRGIWLSPAEVLAENMAGRIPLSPPTLITIHDLLEHTNAKVLQAERRNRSLGAARLPRLVPLPQGPSLSSHGTRCTIRKKSRWIRKACRPGSCRSEGLSQESGATKASVNRSGLKLEFILAFKYRFAANCNE